MATVSYLRAMYGLFIDSFVAVGLFVHWLAVGLIVDEAAGNTDAARKAGSTWVAVVTLGVNVSTLVRSYVLIRKDLPQHHPETVLGLFFEIVSLAQGWGTLFCAARVWSLEAGHPFNAKPFLHNVANSVFEMSLVQSGVGWTGEAPRTLAECITAWCAAYVGGVLCVNLFLVSLVFGRRGWWNFTSDQRAYAMIDAPVTGQQAMARAGEWQLRSLGR